MRIATFAMEGKPRVGIIEGETVLDLANAYRAIANSDGPDSMLDLIGGGTLMLSHATAIARQAFAGDRRAGLFYPLIGMELLAPIPSPRKNIFCVGRNYKLHIEEGARARGVAPTYPTVPEFFTKAPTAVIGPDATIRLDPAVTKKLDYEIELAIIIGKKCRDVAASQAANVIFGYTIVNDVTARDLQLAHGQWFKGKSLDTFCPIGPWIVTADEFDGCRGHPLILRVNGELRQSSTTDDMLFNYSEIVASLSAGMTLEPGDIIATGTPSGVGLGTSPQKWLQDGDVVEAEIPGIGLLRNVVHSVAS